MSKEHITYRVIDGIRYRCIDTGCDDFDRAEYNRYIGEHNLFLAGYRAVEEALERTPRAQPLASWIPRGELPQVNGGGAGRGYRVFELEVVELKEQ